MSEHADLFQHGGTDFAEAVAAENVARRVFQGLPAFDVGRTEIGHALDGLEFFVRHERGPFRLSRR
jgi:hypothetical protein